MGKIYEMTVESMERALEAQVWFYENILGNDWDSQDYIFDFHGGYDEFWGKHVLYLLDKNFKPEELIVKEVAGNWSKV